MGNNAMPIAIGRVATVALALLASGCASPTSSRYDAGDVGQIIETSEGTVVSSRIVEIKGGENSGYGAAAGGATGATAGHVATSGTSSSGLVAVLGAVIGAGIGYLAENSARSREGIEYMVRMDDGRIVTLVQNREEEEAPMLAGTPVFVQYGSDYIRIVEKPAALYGPPPGAAAPGGRWQNPDEPPASSPAQPSTEKDGAAAPVESPEVQ